MSAGWVAGTVRARAVARRRLGPAGARAVAASSGLRDALSALVTGPYGHDVTADQSLAAAQHAVAATLLWDLRVLAGWLPRNGGDRLRVLAGWFELADVDARLQAFAGRPAEPPFRLGSLATAAPRLQAAESPGELRRVLATSAWGDPGGESAREIVLALRFSWAERVVATVPPARDWALAGATLLLAGQVFGTGRSLPDAAAASARRLLGAASSSASLADLAERAPRPARELLAGIDRAEELWRAEARWWARVDAEAADLLRRPRFGLEPVVGAVAATAVDCWRVRAALECAVRGSPALAVFDAVA